MSRRHVAARPRHAFTLIEVLASVAIIAMLVSVMLPSLAGARAQARSTICLSNQRQLVLAWSLYAGAWQDRAMPLANESDPAGPRYWWGAVRPGPGPRIDHVAGFIAPHLDASLGARSVFECPAQIWGTYRPQPASVSPGEPTSTYGYNGYYLTPPATPGWNLQIGRQRWKRVSDVERPGELFVFADTMLPTSLPGMPSTSPPRNTALLDPPQLFAAGTWFVNQAPTTSFRHGALTRGSGSVSANTARADGSVRAVNARPEWLTHPDIRIGSCGIRNDSGYVPDWTRWR
jgi:prepilin-type N-terminal cleavage/methylation domain-containing protein